MKVYSGILIHRDRIGEHYVDVVDDGHFRSLHFDGHSIQSRMLVREPTRLILEYTEAMLLALAFQPQPRRVLMLGLGGGSQAKFLHHHFPQCHIDVVEIEAVVIDIARRFFSLPNDPRLQIHHMDATEFVGSDRDLGDYDLVLIDAYDREGPIATTTSHAFLRRLRPQLTRDAVVAINLWRGNAQAYANTCDDIASALQHPVYSIGLTEDPENIILIVPMQERDGKALLRASKQLDKASGTRTLRHLQNLTPVASF